MGAAGSVKQSAGTSYRVLSCFVQQRSLSDAMSTSPKSLFVVDLEFQSTAQHWQ